MENQEATWSVEKQAARQSAHKIAFTAAVISSILGSLYLMGLLGKLIVDGTVHSTSSQGVQSISAVVALLWNISLLILFVALRRLISGSKKIYADLAKAFMTLVCGISSINWFAQLTILPQLVAAGDPSASLVDVHNNLSITYAVEHLGWGIFFALAVLWMAAGFDGSKLALWIRWLFIGSGVLSILHTIGVATNNPMISDLGYIAWGVLLPAATILLAVIFRKS